MVSEADVWSFGAVPYIPVSGHVRFDDQCVPVLHAKIKHSQVRTVYLLGKFAY